MTDQTNPATLEDVQGTIERPLTPVEEAAIPAWLDQAWVKLQRKVPGIPARMALAPGAPTALDEALVRSVLATMVERKVRNPDGLRSFSVDGTITSTVDAALSSGQIYVSPDEISLLSPPVPSGGVFSMVLGRR